MVGKTCVLILQVRKRKRKRRRGEEGREESGGLEETSQERESLSMKDRGGKMGK